LTNALVIVERENLPDADDDSYYWADLIGLQVVTIDGIQLGKIVRLLETGANDVMVVNGERERLIPWVRESVVKSVDLQAGSITVDWDVEF